MANQRRSFRLDVEIGLETELIGEELLQSGVAELRRRPAWNATLPSALNAIDETLDELLAELSLTAPKAAGAIGLLNQKVDLLRLGQHWGERVRQLPIRRVNLSATGLAFEETSPIEAGRAMHCSITLPTLGWSMELYARVITSRPTGDGRYKVCLDFVYIREEDSEQLIRFNLQQQQQALAEG